MLVRNYLYISSYIILFYFFIILKKLHSDRIYLRCYMQVGVLLHACGCGVAYICI